MIKRSSEVPLGFGRIVYEGSEHEQLHLDEVRGSDPHPELGKWKKTDECD